MGWAGHVACMREVYKGLWWENLKEREHLGDPGVDGRILRWIFRNWDAGVWTGLSWLRILDRWWALVNVVMNL